MKKSVTYIPAQNRLDSCRVLISIIETSRTENVQHPHSSRPTVELLIISVPYEFIIDRRCPIYHFALYRRVRPRVFGQICRLAVEASENRDNTVRAHLKSKAGRDVGGAEPLSHT